MSPSPILQSILENASRVILGKEQQLKLALACILARGHLLIEDLPGMGKSTLAHTLAQTLGLSFQRVQFTNDLMPADIIGVSVYERQSAEFRFHPGPVFTQVLLADELNRATPKTQSALLEAMEERQITLDGQTRPLPQPFFVIATQNPTHHIGAYPLPESQLDRFLMKISLGYPDPRAERDLIKNIGGRNQAITPCIPPETLTNLQQAASEVHVSEAFIDYLQALLATSRTTPAFQAGLSPRAGIAIKQAAQAWALIEGRDYAIPEDLQTILPGTTNHRLFRSDHLKIPPSETLVQLTRVI